MAETIGSLQLTLDPITLLRSQYSDSLNNTDSYSMQRGPRYYAYARLRESKLRLRSDPNYDPPISDFTPERAHQKSFKFQESPVEPTKRRRFSLLGQSVPDFSRKENRRPPPDNRITKMATPPRPVAKVGGGCRYVNSGEKVKQSSSGKLMGSVRKSYASVEELKGLSIAVSSAINGESKKRSNVLRKSAVFSTTTRYY